MRAVKYYLSIGRYSVSPMNMRDRLLDAAEARARRGGYDAFSFRDIAHDVGVKSASVHYHFPTKPDLAQALARRYTQRARERLGDASTLTADEARARVTALFRDALETDDLMCLCGLFGAQRDVLPPSVESEVTAFFQMVLEYLRSASSRGERTEPPEATLARLEGALILARSLRSRAVFDSAIAAV